MKDQEFEELMKSNVKLCKYFMETKAVFTIIICTAEYNNMEVLAHSGLAHPGAPNDILIMMLEEVLKDLNNE